jgi:tetratricopeptide (TPR) repeat protein
MLIKPEQNAAGGGANQTAPKTKPLKVDEQTTRELTDLVLTAAANSSTDQNDFFMLQSLLPELEKRSPERVAQLRRKLTESNDKMDPQYKMMMQYQMLMSDGKPEAILEAAAKAPPDFRAYLYQSAVTKLMQSGDLERARKIVADNLSGPERDRWLEQIDTQLIAKALKEGKMEEARKLLERITPKEARLAQIANMATSLFAKGDRKSALALLDETQELVNRLPENQQEINAMLQVARAYAMIEPARAFGIIEPVLDQANAMLSAVALLEKFGADRGFFKDGEFRMQTSLSYTYTISTQYQKELMALARTDFARTRALADRLQRDEVRLMARLLIAQAVLAERSETENNGGVIITGG